MSIRIEEEIKSRYASEVEQENEAMRENIRLRARIRELNERDEREKKNK